MDTQYTKKNVNTRWRHCALYLTTLLPNVSSLVKLALRRHNTVSGLRQKCFCKAWNNGLKALSSILLTICGAFFKQEAYFKGCPRVILHVAPISRAPCFFHPDFLPVTRCLLFWNALRAEVASLLSLPWRSLAGSRCNPAGCFASPVCDGGGNIRSFFFLHKANRAARAAALTGWVPPHGVGPSWLVSWRSCRLVWVTAAERSWRCWFAVTVHAPARAHHIHNIVCVDRSPFNRRRTARLLLCCLSPVWLGIQVKMRLVEGEMEFACCGEKEAWEEEKKKHASSVCLFSYDGVDAVCVCSTCLAFISLTAVCLLHIV